jgi:hypothetical protein
VKSVSWWRAGSGRGGSVEILYDTPLEISMIIKLIRYLDLVLKNRTAVWGIAAWWKEPKERRSEEPRVLPFWDGLERVGKGVQQQYLEALPEERRPMAAATVELSVPRRGLGPMSEPPITQAMPPG